MYKMNNIYLKRVKKAFIDAPIVGKIMIYYLILLMVSIFFSSFLHTKINAIVVKDKVSELSIQTLYSINSNINSLMEASSNYSKLILANAHVQYVLKNQNGYKDYQRQRVMYQYIREIMDSADHIRGVYIYDRLGHKYAEDKIGVKAIDYETIMHMPWYKKVLELRGSYLMALNGGGIFKSKINGNVVSLIRVINDINTNKPIGLLVMNISEQAFTKAYRDIHNKYNTQLFLKDERGQNLIEVRGDKQLAVNKLFQTFKGEERGAVVKNIDKEVSLVSYLRRENGWTILSIMPFSELSRDSSAFYKANYLIILVNSLLMFFGAIFISKLITKPINMLVSAMRDLEKGAFIKVNIKTGNDEIGRLKDGYNLMVEEIEELIGRIIKEQKFKRKAELNVLQEQIKPHFLYNTFDAISALALMGKNEEVYTIMKALGTYYRASLSKGSEVITIGKEIEIVKNYLVIQNYRYRDMFQVTYDIDASLLHYKILKLVLQPMVENALYHGIKYKGELGLIHISVIRRQENLELIVEDDGVGMKEELICDMLDRAKENQYSKRSFGLRGTIERLRIFYGIDRVLNVKSSEGKGTKVTISIPISILEGENIND